MIARALAAVFASALVACSSDAPPAPVADAAPSCSYPSANASCAACAQKSCCAEADACDADPVCRPFSTCLARCPIDDKACAAQCRKDRPTGYGYLAARLSTCLATHCDRDCGGSCGGYVSNDAKCGTCTESKCCAESVACLEDEVCSDLLACERDCYALDGACLGRCERSHPAAVAPSRKLSACVNDKCSTSCLPPVFRCLDTNRPVGPAVARTSVTLAVQTLNFTNRLPWVGVSVRACDGLDYNCTTPLAGPVVSDAGGWVVLEIPRAKFTGYLEVTGADAKSSLYFLGDITEDSYRNIFLVDESIFLVLTTEIVEPDPTRGHMIITAMDCRGANAAGVTFSIDPADGAIGAYIKGTSLPVRDGPTDANGYGGFINVVPLKGIKVQAKLAAFDRPYPEITAFTRANWIAYVLTKPWSP